MGAAMAPATDSVMSAVPEAKAGVGSAMSDVTRQVGGALGVAVIGSIIATAYSRDMSGAAGPRRVGRRRPRVAERVGGAGGQELAGTAGRAFTEALGSGSRRPPSSPSPAPCWSCCACPATAGPLRRRTPPAPADHGSPTDHPVTDSNLEHQGVTPMEAAKRATEPFENAERLVFERYGIAPRIRTLQLAEPRLRVRVLECGEGPPLLLIPGDGAIAAAWAPLLAELPDRRTIVLDRPGFGLGEGFDYRRADLRRHATTLLPSLLDALEIDSLPVAGSSGGAQWSLWLALHAPARVRALAVMGTPAVCLPGYTPTPSMRMASLPGVGRLLFALPSPSVKTTGKMLARADVRILDHPEILDAYHHAMRLPGYGATASAIFPPVLPHRRRSAARVGADRYGVARITQPTLSPGVHESRSATRTQHIAPQPSCRAHASRSCPTRGTTHGSPTPLPSAACSATSSASRLRDDQPSERARGAQVPLLGNARIARARIASQPSRRPWRFAWSSMYENVSSRRTGFMSRTFV